MADILTREADLIKNEEGGNVARLEANKIILEDGAAGGSSYSTEEKKIGKWIDGRDVYRKVFVIDPIQISGGRFTVFPIPWDHLLNLSCKIITTAYSEGSRVGYDATCEINANGNMEVLHYFGAPLTIDTVIVEYIKEA